MSTNPAKPADASRAAANLSAATTAIVSRPALASTKKPLRRPSSPPATATTPCPSMTCSSPCRRTSTSSKPSSNTRPPRPSTTPTTAPPWPSSRPSTAMGSKSAPAPYPSSTPRAAPSRRSPPSSSRPSRNGPIGSARAPRTTLPRTSALQITAARHALLNQLPAPPRQVLPPMKSIACANQPGGGHGPLTTAHGARSPVT